MPSDHPHHHHHYQHNHGSLDESRTLAEQNEQHFDKVAAGIFNQPWVIKLGQQIQDELRAEIGLIIPEKYESKKIKLLDFACGDGLASRAFAPWASVTRGLDISAGMVSAYNKRAVADGFSHESMHAIQGDILDQLDTPAKKELNDEEYYNFDLAVISMALHHIDNPAELIAALSKRLANGGVLLVVDWEPSAERSFQAAGSEHEDVLQTVARSGFQEDEMRTLLQDAGLDRFEWKLFKNKSEIPRNVVNVEQLFFARAERV